ncbi:MAG: AAA family ATPase, partial [Oscillospiraceae bacterium]|nr:AAA family ATPase [Oscillospiraceae bacterium]
STAFEGVDVIPCNMNLAGAEVELISLDNRESQLKSALCLVKADYDFIFIDCPPSLGLITINSLCSSDTVLVPIQCEYFALEGLSQLIGTIRQVKRLYNPSIEIEGIVLTMFDGRLNLTQQVGGEVKKFFSKELFATTIPRAVRLSEAPSHGKPIQYYDPKNKGGVAYDSLSLEFIKRNGG